MKITPQQALERIQNNVPTSIERDGSHWRASIPTEAFEIDWPEGVDQWPPKKWRVPTEADALLRPVARFRNSSNSSWVYSDDRILLAIVSASGPAAKDRFVSYVHDRGQSASWDFCEIENVTPALPPPPPEPEPALLRIGDTVRVTHKATPEECKHTGGWASGMEQSIGRTNTIIGVSGNDWICLADGYYYPRCVLRKVDPETPVRPSAVLYRDIDVDRDVPADGDEAKTSGVWHTRNETIPYKAHVKYRRKIVTHRGVFAGDGYRLLDVEEIVIQGDDCCVDAAPNLWRESFNVGQPQSRDHTYRRQLD